MKAYLQVFLIFIITIKTFGQDKSFIAIYKLNYNPVNFDSLSNKKNDNNKNYNAYLKSVVKQLENGTNSINNVRYELEFNKQSSLFNMRPILESDVSKAKLLRIILGIREETYYTNKKSIINKKNSYGQDFLVDMPKLNWKISNKQKKIGKFLCYQAKVTIQRENSKKRFNQVITAWFTPEIPYNFGPKYYSGLPGLIISLKENENLTIKLVSLKEKKFEKIKMPKKGKKISYDDFMELSKKMYENRKN